MADAAPTTDVQETPAPDAETTEATTEATAEGVTDAPETVERTGDDLEGLPDWAQKEIKNLRTEAASKRIKNNELLEKLAEAGDPKETQKLVDELKAELAASQRTSLVNELARKHNVPDAALALLTAQNPAELEAQVLAIAALTQGRGPATPPPLSPKGGRDPMAEPPVDPAELYRKAKSRIKAFG